MKWDGRQAFDQVSISLPFPSLLKESDVSQRLLAHKYASLAAKHHIGTLLNVIGLGLSSRTLLGSWVHSRIMGSFSWALGSNLAIMSW